MEEGSRVVMWLELSTPSSRSQPCCVTGGGLSFLFGEMGIMAVPSLPGWLRGLTEMRCVTGFGYPAGHPLAFRDGGSWD